MIAGVQLNDVEITIFDCIPCWRWLVKECEYRREC